jgi:hypothetical protein
MYTKVNNKQEGISVNQEIFKTQVSELVRNTVEKTLNDLLDAEAERLVNAKP